ncbi:EamA family transporter RarD [Salinibacterium sp. dk2585]|uniref:EamA family transporter RarD n=1 Tax=unclassified Salinibacterium TaxID=2632331 RepID=UPI0011C24E7C|nr:MULTISPECIES: EamA family transporter RarD [unclassified Salinibacterium]QEE60658.1 EamA family transporter RarD [Salinibacterium sp. dk2585]TXK55730.1 EamA family transporter RarD [Salinibacterium sp. dk5596]
MSRPAPVLEDVRMQRRAGLLYAVGAYALWGFLPGYFLLLAPSGPFEVVAGRVILSLAFCALLLTITRGWRSVADVVRSPRLALIMGVAAALISVNWLVFVFAALNGQVLASSLGYFINPLFTVLLGVVLLRESLRPLQWVAMGFGAIAIVVLAVGLGEIPWISLALAGSFGLYGLIKKQAGPRVGAVSGLTVETMWLTVPAIVVLLALAAGPGIAAGANGPAHLVLFLMSGVATAVPLLLFAAGARRLPLVTIGLVQYLAPILQFILGAFVLHEAMPPERWVGFGLVWVALVVLTIDMLVEGRMSRRALPQPL